MQGQIDRFVDDLRNSFDLAPGFNIDFKECDGIVLCGMGGSGISGDIVNDMCCDTSRVKVGVLRYPVFPGWVSDKTLAVISSYSGNTWETKAMYREAVDRGCRIVVIASGGEIWDLAEERGDILIPLCNGVQPRQAIGLMIGYICRIIDLVAGTSLEEQVVDSFGNLRKYNICLRGERDNVAKELAEHMSGKIPVIITDTSMASVSSRWKTQISENSKMIAFNCVMPEFNHNEIVGWSTGSTEMLAPIIIMPETQISEMRDVVCASAFTMRHYGTDVHTVKIEGVTRTECILKSVMLGDYVSYYLALMNRVDPIGVEPIKMLKAEIVKRCNGNAEKEDVPVPNPKAR